MIDAQRSLELFRQAEAACDVGRFETAQSLAAQAVAFNPEWSDGYGSLARACLGLTQYSEAEQHCLKGLEKDPNNEWILNLLIIIARFQGSTLKAHRHAQRLLEIAPNAGFAHAAYGNVLKDSDKFKEAISHFDQARKLDPNDTGAIGGLGFCHLSLGNSKIAENHYRESLSLNPNNARHLNNLGVALQEQGKLKDAALAFKAAVIVDPNLEVSKSNAKHSIAAYLSVVSVGGGGMILYLIAKVGMVAGRSSSFGGHSGFSADEMGQLGAVVVIVLLALAAMFGLFVWGRRMVRKAELKSADPQILEFYKTVCNDPNVD